VTRANPRDNGACRRQTDPESRRSARRAAAPSQRRSARCRCAFHDGTIPQDVTEDALDQPTRQSRTVQGRQGARVTFHLSRALSYASSSRKVGHERVGSTRTRLWEEADALRELGPCGELTEAFERMNRAWSLGSLHGDAALRTRLSSPTSNSLPGGHSRKCAVQIGDDTQRRASQRYRRPQLRLAR